MTATMTADQRPADGLADASAEEGHHRAGAAGEQDQHDEDGHADGVERPTAREQIGGGQIVTVDSDVGALRFMVTPFVWLRLLDMGLRPCGRSAGGGGGGCRGHRAPAAGVGMIGVSSASGASSGGVVEALRRSSGRC